VFNKEGEVVTRQVYENVRLDHLLSKEQNKYLTFLTPSILFVILKVHIFVH